MALEHVYWIGRETAGSYPSLASRITFKLGKRARVFKQDFLMICGFNPFDRPCLLVFWLLLALLQISICFFIFFGHYF